MDNDYSSKIKCILEEGKKHQERCCIVGPTGPQGPTGLLFKSSKNKIVIKSSHIPLNT